MTVTPLTWNVIGLDSNSPASGPRYFPVGARICSSVATTNVAVNFIFDSANANVALRAGSLSTINLPSIGAGACADAYFEVDVTPVPAAYDTTRRYHITATDGSGTASSSTPRELYVEHLISQNRNAITDIKFGPNPLSLTSVPAGGSMNLVVGSTYTIQLLGGTATQGYNQFEAFINFPDTIFQILGVSTTYSADNSPFVPNPDDRLYANACLWENDPNSPNYRSCTGGDFKAGGSNVVTTYTVKIISGGGTSQTLNSLLYDFSGSSYHYNGDYTTGARIVNIIDPASATISKSFSPNPVPVNSTDALTITLTNPNSGTLTGYSFIDNLPANLVVASAPAATTSGCGAPTLTANAGAGSITFSNGTLAANSTCLVKVNVTPTATGSLVNTTNNLFIGTIDTGHNATATLTVNNAPPPGTGLCGITLADWSVPNGTTANPPDLTGGLPTVKAANVTTATLAANVAGNTAINTTSGHIDTTSWGTYGYKNAGQFTQFTLDTANYSGVQMGFWVANPSPANGPSQITVTVDNGGGFGAPVLTINSPVAAFTQHTLDLTGLTNTSGNTLIRITATGANNDASGASLLYDNMTFTGCTAPVKPTISKAFSPNPIAVNGVSTLTFTLVNTNTAPLTGAAFTDALPNGLHVAATPAAGTTCGGTWTPAAGATTLSFSGGTLPASSACTVSCNVTTTTAGPHSNVSGFLSSTEGGTNTTSIASSALSGVLPPSIAKRFAPSPVLAGGTSTLTLTITNPNQNNTLSGVAFGDTFPTSPGAMVVAAAPNPTTSGCGSPAFSPTPGSGSIVFSGGTIAGGDTCTVTVNITAPATGTYTNTSSNVSHVINAQTINGNTASAPLVVNPPNPSIRLLKQVSDSLGGQWYPFLGIPAGNGVYYQFTVENTGDVALLSPQLADGALDVSTCNAAWSGLTLPLAVAANNNHLLTCVAGPVTAVNGVHTNIATVSATFNGAPVIAPNSPATYATTGLTLEKNAVEGTFTLPGDLLHYSYLVTNSGFDPLAGPVTVADNRTTVTCPAVTTVGDLDNFLDPGEAITCTAMYTITGSDVANAQVTNIASASADSVISNSASKTVPLSTSADVSMNKTLTTSGPYFAGQSVTYTLVVANAGPSTATSIQVTDTPTNLTITNVSGSGCAALPCTIASLASGANTQIFVTATINTTGAFDNRAAASAVQPDPNPSNNTDNTGNGGTTGATADLAISKTDGSFTYLPGGTTTYTIVVSNAGPGNVTGASVGDNIPGQVTNWTWSCVADTVATCTAGPVSSSADYTDTVSIPSGKKVTYTVVATLSAAATGDLVNTATVTAPAGITDPDTNNNSATDTDTPALQPDLTVSKIHTGSFVQGQTNGQYTVVVTNSGSGDKTAGNSVAVTDTPPTGMMVADMSGTGWNCTALPTCTRTDVLTAGSSYPAITVTVSVADSATSPRVNSVAVSLAGQDESNSSNNTASDSTIIVALNILNPPSGAKTVSDAGYPALQWRMSWINSGNAVATMVSVTDDIASGTSYVPGSLQCDARGSSSTAVCAYDSVTRRITWQGNIGPDLGAANEAQAQNEVVITYRTTVPADVTQIENQACAHWDRNGDGSLLDEMQGGQTPVCTNDPSTQAAGDPTVWTKRQNVAVPALDVGGALVFMILAGLWAIHHLRRRAGA